MAKETEWRSIVIAADPEHIRRETTTLEYEFSGPWRTQSGNDEDEVGQAVSGGRRAFYGKYKNRGPYVPAPIDPNGLTWNGVPLTWNGLPLAWDEE